MKAYQHKVQYYETDKMQFTHHSNYIRFMEEARIDFMEQTGWGYDKLEASGIVSPVIAVTCDYKKSTSFPDLIRIYTNIEELSPVKLKLQYTMMVEDKVVCHSTSTHCFLNQNGRPVNLKKQSPEFYHRMEKLKEEGIHYEDLPSPSQTIPSKE